MVDFHNSIWVLLLGGVAIFMYGMGLSSSSLEKLLASRLSRLLNRLSQNQVLAIIVGIMMTTVLQSSGAVTSMLVGLGSAKVISLPQVMGVIIGTAIGSTLTVQIVSFNLSQYALPLLFVSFFTYFFAKKPEIKNLVQVGIGFGFVFLGLGLISSAAHSIAAEPWLQHSLNQLRENNLLSLLVAAAFCALVHSSAVTIGLAMSLTQAGVLTLDQAMYWVYGANIGTTSQALIAAAGSNYIGRQVAWAHFFYKFISVLIFMIEPIHKGLLHIVGFFDPSPFRAIANGHLWFNLLSAGMFYPFIRPAARQIEKLFPKDAKDEFATEFLRQNNYQSTALATSYANREILRTADLVLSMIQDAIRLFEKSDSSMIESIRDRDNKVDFLYRETKMFLLDHANKSNTAVHQNIMSMIMFLSDLERAADAIDINLAALAIKKNALKLEFSREGWAEIQIMHTELVKVSMVAINAYQQKELCEQAISNKRDLARLEIQLREHHIERLNRGMRETINTSSIHLDLLSEFKRIASLLCAHAYSATKDV